MIIVVTGVSRGLGRAMVDRLAESGHIVLGCARAEKRITALRKTYEKPHDFDTVDVADADQVDRWAARLLERWGAPDFLINNASLINRNAPLWRVPPAEFSEVIDVNIKGIANTVRSFAPAMVSRRAGVIVNFSSTWGRSASAEVAPYCATKWAVEGLTRALSLELPLGMTAVSLNPGIINTDMLQSCMPSHADSFISAEEWSRKAVPFILNIKAHDNGMALTAP